MILTDRYGQDTSWEVRDDDGKVVVQSENKYGTNEEDVVEFCLEDGFSYDFVVHDEYSDGMVRVLDCGQCAGRVCLGF